VNGVPGAGSDNDVGELDEHTRRIIATAARLFLAHWEGGTALGDRFDESLDRAAERVAAAESEVTTAFYRVALRDPALQAALRRCVRAAAYLEGDMPSGPGPPDPQGPPEAGP